MLRQKALFDQALSRAGIAIDGPTPWDIHVMDERFYARLSPFLRRRLPGAEDTTMAARFHEVRHASARLP